MLLLMLSIVRLVMSLNTWDAVLLSIRSHDSTEGKSNRGLPANPTSVSSSAYTHWMYLTWLFKNADLCTSPLVQSLYVSQ